MPFLPKKFKLYEDNSSKENKIIQEKNKEISDLKEKLKLMRDGGTSKVEVIPIVQHRTDEFSTSGVGFRGSRSSVKVGNMVFKGKINK